MIYDIQFILGTDHLQASVFDQIYCVSLNDAYSRYENDPVLKI